MITTNNLIWRQNQTNFNKQNMKIPESIKVYGDKAYRNKKCPKEKIEQITFVNRIRELYPETYGAALVHIKNEALLVNGQFTAITTDRAMGMSKGASDIMIPGRPAFVLELKRRDHTASTISDEQINYLITCKKLDAFVCVALGADAAMEAFDDWRKNENFK